MSGQQLPILLRVTAAAAVKTWAAFRTLGCPLHLEVTVCLVQASAGVSRARNGQHFSSDFVVVSVSPSSFVSEISVFTEHPYAQSKPRLALGPWDRNLGDIVNSSEQLWKTCAAQTFVLNPEAVPPGSVGTSPSHPLGMPCPLGQDKQAPALEYSSPRL